MKRRILWLGLSFLVVAALVLSSCAKEEVVTPGEQEEEEEVVTPGEQEEEEEVVVPAAGEPQYGGTLTMMTRGLQELGNADIGAGPMQASYMLSFVQEKPIMGDFEEWGPRGKDEFKFQTWGYIPDKYQTGLLLESWEITREQITWHVQPGIMWAPTEAQQAWMPVRELTADDIVADINHFKPAAGAARFKQFIGDVYATDRYTLVIETGANFSLDLNYYLSYEDRACISPPEAEVAGLDKWENQVGTGPFMIGEYAVGSFYQFLKNPNYTHKVAHINGVEYQIPFVDEMILPLIPDSATQIAALRTGKLDFHQGPASDQWATLESTAPALLSAHYSCSGWVMALKTTEPPFNDENVRRAMMIGTDLKAVGNTFGLGPLPVDWYPALYTNADVYIPISELPAETQLLYTYNPTLARKMLSDAGYPTGFTVHLTTSWGQDQFSLIKDQWAKIGVNLIIDIVDGATHTKMVVERTYKGIGSGGQDITAPINTVLDYGKTGYTNNWAGYSNPYYDDLCLRIVGELDPVARTVLIKEAMQILRNTVAHLPITPTMSGHYWWPWIKNYYGEFTTSDGTLDTIPAYMWIDQDLKAEMGYK